MKRAFKLTIEGEIQYLSSSDPKSLIEEAVLRTDILQKTGISWPGRYRVRINRRELKTSNAKSGGLLSWRPKKRLS